MADRVDFYFRQRVTEAELDLGFELLERADRNLAADLGVFGVVAGAVPTPHAPLADLSIDLTAPGRAYDHLGQRVAFGSGQTVTLTVDSTGIPTDVSMVGQERWVGVFLRFKRLLSDPRTDGNSQQIFFRREESFEIVVRQGAQAVAGSAPKVALVDDEPLLCDVRRSAGQTQIFAADIDVSRRQAFIFTQGSSVGVIAAFWKVLAKTTSSVQAALDAVDGLLFGHFSATASRHKADDVDVAAHGFVTSTTLGAALIELIDDLVSAKDGSSGAARVGVDTLAGTPFALAPSNVRAHLSQLLAWLNGHVSAPANAHAASAIGAAPHSFVASTSVQAQLQEIAADLQSPATGQGAALIGSEALGGAPRPVAATKARDQALAILNHLNAHIGSGDHDSRYARRVLTNGAHYAAGEVKDLGTVAGGRADQIILGYSTVDANGNPVDPRYTAGPYMDSIHAWFTTTAGGHVYVQSHATVALYIYVDAFAVN